MIDLASSIVSDEEVQALIMALARGMKQFTQDDARKLVAWAEDVRLAQGLLDLYIAGKLDCTGMDDDGPRTSTAVRGVETVEGGTR